MVLDAAGPIVDDDTFGDFARRLGHLDLIVKMSVLDKQEIVGSAECARRYRKIAASLREVLAAIGEPMRDQMRVHLTCIMGQRGDAGDPDSELDDQVEAVRSLARSFSAAAEMDDLADTGTVGRPTVLPPGLMREILQIWELTLRREVRTSVDLDGRASGPLIRFVDGCLKTLGFRLSPAAVRQHIRRSK
jgi:hypothetical protein